jgi:O-antigen/teichoic acid export membrane protein
VSDAEAGRSETEAPPMRRRVMGGLGWTGASEAVVQVLRMLTAIILARLLAPDDYGLAALALVFSSLVLVFSDLALGAAIVQRKELTEDDRATAFWMSVGAGIVFTILGVALSGPVASFYGEPSVAPLCAAMAGTFLIVSLATTHEALLLREFKFARLEQRVMISTLAGVAAGIFVGVQTRDAWAIIAQQITQSVVSTILLWKFSPWRPSLRFSRESLRTLGSFSGYLVGHRLLYYFHRNADNILIGRFIGAAALGAYTLAYNVMLVPMSRIAGPVQKVLGPTFARMQDEPERIAAAWIRVVRLLAMVSAPALMGLVVVAPDFVSVALGAEWAAAVPLIQVLAWVGLLQALQSVNTDILQARGRTSTIFRFTILFSVAHVVAFAIGLQWGVVGVAVAYAVSSTLVEPIYTWLTAREIGISAWRVVGAVRGVLEAGLIMMAAVLAARTALVDLDVPALARLVLCVGLGTAVFGLASAWRAPEAWAEVRGVLGHALGGRSLPAPLLRRLARKAA